MSNSRKRKTGGAFRRTTQLCGLYAKPGKDRTTARRGKKKQHRKKERDGKMEIGKWISVKDRLPKRGTVLATDGCIVITAPASSVTADGPAITHWMPLPAPPKEGDEDAT